MTQISLYSLIPVMLGLSRNGNQLSTATGFFVTDGSKLYLLSNWHVFSGRDFQTGQPLDKNGAVPNLVETYVASHNSLPAQIGWHLNSFQLEDQSGQTTWRQHAARGQSVDIAFLEIGNVTGAPTRLAVAGASPDVKLVTDWAMGVGSEVFVVGFPLGLTSTAAPLPIWKRASIASEPDLDVSTEPFMRIDTATREGMSGSPVFLFQRGQYFSKGGTRIGLAENCQVVGVYSGRVGAADLLAAQIGLVWKWALVEEMIANPSPGSYQLRTP